MTLPFSSSSISNNLSGVKNVKKNDNEKLVNAEKEDYSGYTDEKQSGLSFQKRLKATLRK